MIEDLFLVEKQAYQTSVIHQLDARIKIVIAFAGILSVVAFPYITAIYLLGGLFFIFFGLLWLLSGLSPMVYIKRLILTLPFGIFIIFFQIFFKNPHYADFHPVAALPLGIFIYAESIEFASILLIKFIICISFIILLSSTTKMHDLLKGARRLGLPAEFALCIGMMIRYLFVFAQMLRRIKNAMDTRCFDPFDQSLSYRYRLQILGNTVGMMFIRSYEQGERTYMSMLCRGYSVDSHVFTEKKPLRLSEWAVLGFSLIFIIGATAGIYLSIV
jgi:cobalt/nickel transport system permease protein